MTKRKPITFSIDEKILKYLLGYCKKTGQKKGEVIRESIFEYLKEYVNFVPDKE